MESLRSDIEDDPQFTLPDIPDIYNVPIGGFINLQGYFVYRDVPSLPTPSKPYIPTLHPDWFRPELNPDFATVADRKVQRQRTLSLEDEGKLNKKRRKQRKPFYGVAIKNGKEFYHPYPQLRDKFHHAPIIGVPVPITLADKMDELALNSNYKKRLIIFRNPKMLPPEFVEVSAIKLREHVIDSDTYLIKGTFGKNQEAKRKKLRKENSNLKEIRHRKGFLLYNPKTNLVAFYDKKTRRLVTYLAPSPN